MALVWVATSSNFMAPKPERESKNYIKSYQFINAPKAAVGPFFLTNFATIDSAGNN